MGSSGTLLRWRSVLALVAVVGLVVLPSVVPRASAAPTPVVMALVCVNASQGQMSFPISGACASGQVSFAVNNPASVLATCYLLSNGAIRKVSSSADCVQGKKG